MDPSVTDDRADALGRGQHGPWSSLVLMPAGGRLPPVVQPAGSAVDADREDDPYAAATAEFYELLATAHWEMTGPALRELLARVDVSAGPIVDVGAGTGIGLPYLLDAVPDAELYAIEPSKAMRTALHIRLSLDPSLREKVTVDPRRVAEALPPSAAAIVMSAVIGHLTDDELTTLWRYVAERMPLGAPLVIELLPPDRPIEVPSTRYRSLPVGRHVYEGWQAGQPVDERTMRWTMTYRVLDGADTVAEYEVRSDYRCWSAADIRAEVEPLGLEVAEHDEWVVIRRPV